MKIENQYIQQKPNKPQKQAAYNRNKFAQSKKRRGGFLSINFFVPFVALLIVILMLATVLASDSAIFTIQTKQEKLTKLEKRFSTVRNQNDQRRSRILNKNTPEFLYEKMARRQGLKKPGEIIINMPDRSIFDKKADKLIENYEKRRNFSYNKVKDGARTSRIAISIIFGIIFLVVLIKFISNSPLFVKVPRFFEENRHEVNYEPISDNHDINNNDVHFSAEPVQKGEAMEIPEGWDENEMAELMKLKAEFGIK